MVYESDFYTTRRPYSSSRPYTSSYSVTPLRGLYYLYDPYVSRFSVRAVPHMPYTAHRKLVTIVRTVPVRIYHAGLYWPVVRTIRLHTRVRPSIIAAELNRIRYLQRPSYVSHVEHYLNSKGFTDFDDEAKDIRAKTAKLLRKIHVFVPRPSISDYEEHTLPERLRSDDYVRRIINAKNLKRDIDSLPWYSSPEKRSIGEGHLACIKYAGGRPQAKRRSYYTLSDLVPGDVRTDVKLMSYYQKNRKAAEDASPLIVQHDSVPISEDLGVGAPTTVTWADEIVREKEIVEEEEPVTVIAAQKEDEVECPRDDTTALAAEPELTEVKPEKKKKKERKPLKAVATPVVAEDEVVEAEVEVEQNNVEAVPVAEKEDEEKKLAEEQEKEAEVEAEVVCEEDGVQKTPDDDTIKRVTEYIEKKAAEKKMEEERRAWELEEARKHAEELEIARLAKIKEEEDIRRAEMKEQERLEAERRAILDRAEELRKEAERLKEDEKLFNVAIQQAIADEKERVAQEEEEFMRRQLEEDREDKLDADTLNDLAIADEPQSEEHSLHADLSDQEVEAKPYELDHDEDTQIEEDEPEEQTELENPFDGEGAAIATQGDEPVDEAPTVRTSGGAGDEGGFDWSEIDAPQVEEETKAEAVHTEDEVEETADDNQQVFEEEHEETQKQIESEETQVEESEAEAEQAEPQVETEEVNIWEDVTEQMTSSWRRTSTYRQEEAEMHVLQELRRAEQEARAEDSDGVQIESVYEGSDQEEEKVHVTDDDE